MLILTRRIGEILRIGEEVSVTVLGVKGNQVRLGIAAPTSVAVHREEIFQKIVEENQAAADSPVATPPGTKIVRVESKRARRPTGT